MYYSLSRLSVIVLCLLFSFIPNRSDAQLNADFTASPLSGCAPLIVNFTDISTGGATSWRWDLGNGTISTLQNPTATYFNPGSYSVKLVVRNSSGSDSLIRQQYITVFPKPVAAFTTSDSTGCFPHSVQFSDQSSSSAGTITNWFWDFGDGTTSTLANPLHTYTIAGNFTVSLRVVNSNGCNAIITRQAHIIISSGVTADFTNTSAATCASTPTIQFTNTSTGPGTLSYEWHFGDGSISALANPQHTYTTPGSYTVTLIATSPQGCQDTIVKENLITYGSIRSEFTFPESVCVGAPFTLTNTTTPVPGTSTWDFGDGTIATGTQPVKIYTTAGTYIIKLVNDFGACKDSVTHEVIVKAKPSAAFTADQTSSCRTPFPVTFTPGASTGNDTYTWSFGDGSSSTEQQPVHTYTAPGEYTVTLIVTNSEGCSDTLVRPNYISIKLPGISVTGFPRTGCLPMTVTPVATVTASEPVVSYQWNFGDGGTGTGATPTYTYTTPGTFTVTVTITTASGCTQTLTIPDAVKAGLKPSANFVVNPNDVCASQAVSFSDASTGAVIDQWFWNFGDGTTSTLQNPSHVYNDTGYFDVTLVVWSNTCADTIRLDDIVHIRPPIARFIIINNCTDKYTKRFTNLSIGALTWAWSFGDGNSSNAQSPSHTYSAPGVYTVTLTVTNGSCSYTTTRPVFVVDEKSLFTADRPVSCRNSSINFTAPSINAANIQQWQWNFGDGSPVVNTASATSHSYVIAGTYNVTLIITDVLGCRDTSSNTITVYGPTAAFTIPVPNVCLDNGTVVFSDQSTTDGQHAITTWKWEYGDGASETYSAPPFQHTYSARGSYNVTLTVTDQYGCSDVITKNNAVIIAKPIAGFYSPDTASCINKPVSFINTSVGETMSYQWSFGDGGTGTQINPVHNYSATGLYTIQLNVVDQYGCKDTLVKPDYINISLPVAGFLVSDSIGNCPPLRVVFTNRAQNSVSIRWDFGDGNTSVLTDPEHTYTLAGIYYATQYVTGPGGCMDTISKRIEVKGPSGTFTYSPLLGCDPLTVNFTATTQNQSSILWDFTDGATATTTGTSITHTYTTPGDYIPRMILTDAAGCNVPVQGSDTIRVIGVRVDFSMSNTSNCDQATVNFTNTTVSNDYITSWNWNFGDGGTSNMENPQHHYSNPGMYTVSLQAFTASGCSGILVLTDTIRIYPRPLITITGDASGCIPANVQFTGGITRGDAAQLHWNWNMGNGQTDTLQVPAVQSYATAGTYTITAIVTDQNSCRDTATHIFTANPLPNVNAGADEVLCLGTPVQLTATGAATYTWLPATSLSCTNCSDPVANPTDNITYVVRGFNSFGCSNIDSVSIRVRKPFDLLVGPGDTLCLGETYRLSASGADLYQWSPASTLSNSTVANPLASPVTTTVYQVIGTDNDNCFHDTATVSVKVYPVPTVDAGPDQVLAVGSSTQLTAVASPDVTSYTWTPAYNISCASCSTTAASPRRTTQYNIEVRNDGGCLAKDAMTVTVVCANANLFIPNTFSPNGNGMNEYFYPRGKGIAKIRSLLVFNRWGEVVFERFNFDINDASAGWDGTHKGKKLSADVFVYICEAVCENNEVLSYKGDVTLLR